MIRRVSAILLLFALLQGGARADTITLHRSAVIEPGAAVRLSDIADLEGPRAEALAPFVLVDDIDELPRGGTPGTRRLGLPFIRQRLKSAPGVNWAMLGLRGSTALISPPPPSRPEPGARETTHQKKGAARPEQRVLPGSIRALAREVLIDILKVGPEDLRVRWPDRKGAFLDEPVAGRTVHIQPLGRSSRLPLTVTVYEGDRIVRTETVRPDIRVRRTVWVVSSAIRRGTVLSEKNTTRRSMWLEPGVSPAGEVIGKVTSRRLEAGAVIETGDVEPPLIVRRGEIVSLDCVAGAVMLRCAARALEPGHAGDVIRFELLSSKEKVTARMSGRGRAVMVVPTAERDGVHPERGEGSR